ncbi:MAG: phytanoyl-CoA dioxygenase family protein [Boseongicola sp.]|nr:phytanoyl-CoA dioxygenase family protein [Boseongicola sp.]
MTASLSPDEISAYRRDGFLFPVRVMDASEAREARDRLEDVEKRFGPQHYRGKVHLVLPFVRALVGKPEVLGAVESLIGPDILLWDCTFIVKEPGAATRVAWHQDLTYWALEPAPTVVSIWIAFSASTVESGCVKMLPGTHRHGQLAHAERFSDGNILSRGQEIGEGIDPSAAVDVVLQPGEMSLHHGHVAHASQPNRSKDRRIGLNAQYISANTRPTSDVSGYALSLRGKKRNLFFDEEFDPSGVYATADCKRRDEILAARNEIIYA